MRSTILYSAASAVVASAPDKASAASNVRDMVMTLRFVDRFPLQHHFLVGLKYPKSGGRWSILLHRQENDRGAAAARHRCNANADWRPKGCGQDLCLPMALLPPRAVN